VSKLPNAPYDIFKTASAAEMLGAFHPTGLYCFNINIYGNTHILVAQEERPTHKFHPFFNFKKGIITNQIFYILIFEDSTWYLQTLSFIF
jgi:hypothetical protein